VGVNIPGFNGVVLSVVSDVLVASEALVVTSSISMMLIDVEFACMHS